MIWEALLVTAILCVLAVMVADQVRARRRAAASPLPPVPGAHAPPVIKPLPSAMPGLDLTAADRSKRAPAGMTVDELSTLLDNGNDEELNTLMVRLEERTFEIEGVVTRVEFDKVWITVTLVANSSRRIDVAIYFPTSMAGQLAPVTSSGWYIKAEAVIYVGLSGLRPSSQSLTFHQPILIDLVPPSSAAGRSVSG
jgi:hypothetical protein